VGKERCFPGLGKRRWMSGRWRTWSAKLANRLEVDHFEWRLATHRRGAASAGTDDAEITIEVSTGGYIVKMVLEEEAWRESGH